jgi:hypothetical protein
MIIDHCRDLLEFQNFFYEYPMPKNNQFDFHWVINNPNLFCFYGEEKKDLRAYIVLHEENGNLYLSGASCRKNFLDNIQGIIKVCNAFDCDIYSYTKLKQAGLLLRKAGFKKISDYEYIRTKNNGK